MKREKRIKYSDTVLPWRREMHIQVHKASGNQHCIPNSAEALGHPLRTVHYIAIDLLVLLSKGAVSIHLTQQERK